MVRLRVNTTGRRAFEFVMGGECGLVQIRATSVPILDPVGRQTYTRNIWPKTRGRPPIREHTGSASEIECLNGSAAEGCCIAAPKRAGSQGEAPQGGVGGRIPPHAREARGSCRYRLSL